jgi:hypothetical protein
MPRALFYGLDGCQIDALKDVYARLGLDIRDELADEAVENLLENLSLASAPGAARTRRPSGH